ncbi:MAG: UDP-N-acetylmuramate dehydrogenase [Alphaproteobacteria bacterium]|nr:UDP-N-acetylmuramate dehydrogenase [Alphaproteobacteria bacterium]
MAVLPTRPGNLPDRKPPEWFGRLPPVRGSLSAHAPLAGTTWFGVGGPAEVMFRPADADDLAAFLVARPPGVPVTVIGVGSNLLIRDGGVPGVVIRLGRGFADIALKGAFAGIAEKGERLLVCGAAALGGNIALTARNAGLTGLEFLSGIPGTLGGALRMNAGAYGREIKDVLVAAEALDPEGGRHILTPADMGFGYRRCGIPSDWSFIGATLAASHGETPAIDARMFEIRAAREASQPVRSRTGGSTFANPPGHRAWELIDRAGCRGLTRGGAMISDKHCNFLINTGTATAADLEDLGEEVRARVLDNSGVALEWEIRRIGVRGCQGNGGTP